MVAVDGFVCDEQTENRKKSGKTAMHTNEEAQTQRGKLVLAGCRSAAGLAAEIYQCYLQRRERKDNMADVIFLDSIDTSFSDTESLVRLDEHVGGADVFLIQSLYNPANSSTVNDNYLPALVAARAFREHGARHITALFPYLAYARQDKPTRFMREPTTAALMADLSKTAGIDRIITWHPHSRQIQGFYGNTPVTMLDPLPYFVRPFSDMQDANDVIVVAPDAGAAKVSFSVSKQLQIACAVTSKHRPGPEEVENADIIGDFSGKSRAIIYDDIISSGRTIETVAAKLVREKGIEKLYLCISHCLYSTRALEVVHRLYEQYGLQRCYVTNSIAPREEFRFLPRFSIYSLSGVFASVIDRIHRELPVSELFIEGFDERPM
ncbi:MAG: ribose-phosphate diphosphokinase [Chitinivibrionales bacterium]|nr:ribose-phosphate diphosphokinase [Chitinivibrionales bacterium]